MTRRGSDDRATAARLLLQVVGQQRTSDQALASLASSPLAREMFLGSLRHYYSLTASVTAALHEPPRAKDQDIVCLLIVGAYQLRHMRVPDHAAVHATVEACGALGKPWARGLVNAVLRKLGREAEATERSFELPEWMERRLREDYGTLAEPLMLANLERAPMTLRINRQRLDPERYKAYLTAEGLAFDPLWLPEAVVLRHPANAEQLPGFADGAVAVQDAGALFAAEILQPQSGTRVLDACAAPGGKLFHLLERDPTLKITAVELSPARREHLLVEARRLGHHIEALIGADATTLQWWDGTLFDHVLLDAPCTGSGTLRRHPDSKLLRREADLPQYTDLQRRLLANLWRTLTPGGTLLYCTCSVFDAENDGVVGDFLTKVGDAELVDVNLPTGVQKRCGWQLLPTNKNTDGFYYACLKKRLPEAPPARRGK